MQRLMSKIIDRTPKRNLGNSAAKTSRGLVSLWLTPTSRGFSMFYRKDWYLNGAKISAKALSKIELNDDIDNIEITHLGK